MDAPETARERPRYSHGVAAGLALAAVGMLAWQAVSHGAYLELYAGFQASAHLPAITTLVLSPPFRVGAPAAIVAALLLLRGRPSAWPLWLVAALGWATVVIAQLGATAPLRELSGLVR